MTAARDAIAKGLAEVWDTGGRRFVTFEIAGDDDRWVQWIDGELNVRWPFDDDPATGLPRRGVRLPAAAAVRSFVAGGSLILGAWDLRAEDTADLIDGIFRRILADSTRYEVEVRITVA